MKKLILMIALFSVAAHAQSTHFLIGPTGGYVFDNTSIGIESGIELPLGNHFELDDYGVFNPVEFKTVLGRGYSYTIESGAIIWVNKTSGFEGDLSVGGYSVTKAAKNAIYAYGGYVYRHNMFGMPTRFSFDYMRQIRNGISLNGTETNHVQGGVVSFDTLFGCLKHECVRTKFTWYTAHILNQSDPICDGTFGNGSQAKPPMGPCPRTGDIGGGFSFSLMFEFPRRKSNSELF